MKPFLSRTLLRAWATIPVFAFLTTHPILSSVAAESSSPAEGEAVVLSPFEIQADSVQGYVASNSTSGTRINLPLIEVPQTIHVVTEDFLRDTNAFNLDEAVSYVSGVSETGFFGSQFSVRGFVVGPPKRNGLSNITMQTLDTAGVERIEMVKGPASVLYGVGSPGGVVNVITKKPKFEAERSTRFALDAEGGYRGEIDVTGSIDEGKRAAYRFIAAYQDQQSTIQFGERESLYLAPSLSFKLREGPQPTVLNVLFEWTHVPHMISWDERWPQVVEQRPAPLPSDPDRMRDIAVGYVPGLPDDFNVAGPNAERLADDTYFETSLTHSFTEDLSARLVYQDAETNAARFTQFLAGSFRYTDGALPTTVPIQSFYQDFDTRNRALQLDANWSFDGEQVSSNVIVGGSLTKTFTDRRVWRNFGRDPVHPFAMRPEDYELGTFPADYTMIAFEQVDHEEGALWAIGHLRLLDERLAFLGGVRQDYVRDAATVNRLSGSPVLVPGSDVRPDLPLTYQAGATYSLRKDLVAFVSYTESQRTNLNFPNDPQTGEGWETGLRFKLFDGRLSGSFAVFDITNQNIQRTDFNLPDRPFVLSGEERSRGWEVDLFWFPHADWQIVANYTDMDPEVVSNVSAPVTEGSTIDDAFRHAGNLFVKYTPTTGPLEGFYVTAGTNIRSKSKPFGTLENLYLLENPSYTLFNASVGWTTGHFGERTTYELAAKNLTDKFYWGNTAIPGEGRMVIGSVRIEF